MSEAKKLANDIISHIGKTSDQLEATDLVLDVLFDSYDDNVELITELLYFKYDLQGM